jgi:hypothetical protein
VRHASGADSWRRGGSGRYCPIVQTQHQQLLIEVLFADLQRARLEAVGLKAELAIERAGRFGGDHDRGVQLVDTAAGVLDHAGDQRRAETVAAAVVEAPDHDLGKRKKPKGNPGEPLFAHTVPERF